MLQQAQLEQYCELIAALKLRATNKQGRHLSARRAIELLGDYGLASQQGLVKAPKPTEIKALFHNMLNPAPHGCGANQQ